MLISEGKLQIEDKIRLIRAFDEARLLDGEQRRGQVIYLSQQIGNIVLNRLCSQERGRCLATEANEEAKH